MTPADFKAAREALGWSRVQLAERLGYASENSVRKIEAGTNAPHPAHAEWLAAASAYLRAVPRPTPEPPRPA